MKKLLEADIQKQILDYLRLRGHLALRINTQGVPLHGKREGKFRPSPMRGVSDIIGCQKGTGRMFAIEVKRPGGKLSPEQVKFLSMVHVAGGIATMANCLEHVQDVGL